MNPRSWPPLVAILVAFLCLLLTAGTIVLALIPLYLSYKGDGITLNKSNDYSFDYFV